MTASLHSQGDISGSGAPRQPRFSELRRVTGATRPASGMVRTDRWRRHGRAVDSGSESYYLYIPLNSGIGMWDGGADMARKPRIEYEGAVYHVISAATGAAGSSRIGWTMNSESGTGQVADGPEEGAGAASMEQLRGLSAAGEQTTRLAEGRPGAWQYEPGRQCGRNADLRRRVDSLGESLNPERRKV